MEIAIAVLELITAFITLLSIVLAKINKTEL